MRILVASENIVKISATAEAFSNFFEDFSVEGLSTNSLVSHQPFGEDVFIGAKNRAFSLAKSNSADFYVGIEGGVDKIHNIWFGFGVIAILNFEGKLALGTSPHYQLTDKIIEKLKNGMELGDVIDECSGEINTKTKGGAIGYFTKNIFKRKDLYVSGIVMALVPFLNKKLFFDENK